MSLNDYHMCFMPNNNEKKKDSDSPVQKLQVDDTVKWHKEAVTWIKKEIKEAKKNKEKIVILSHHAPTFNNSSDPKYQDSENNTAFATNLEYLFPDVDTWCFGHTHWNADQYMPWKSEDQQSGKTRVVTNQFGYVRMELAQNYVPSKVVNIY